MVDKDIKETIDVDIKRNVFIKLKWTQLLI